MCSIKKALLGSFCVAVIAMFGAAADAQPGHEGHNHPPGMHGMAPPAAVDPGPVVLKVNGKEIRQGQIEEMANQMMMQNPQFQQASSAEEINALRTAVREEAKDAVIDQALFEEARENYLKEVSDEAINGRMKQIEEQMEAQGRSLDDVMAQFGDQIDVLKLEIRKELAGYVMAEKMADMKEPTEAEAQALFEQHKGEMGKPDQIHTRHILLGYTGNPRDPSFTPDPAEKIELKKKAEAARQRVTEGGEDFAAVAKEISSCPSAAQGGDLNFHAKGQMVPAYDASAWNLEIGGISDVVETQFGYHVIKLEERKAGEVAKYEDYKFRILDFLRSQKFEEAVPKMIEKLRADAKIETVTPSAG